MTRGVGGQGPANIMKHLGGLDFPATKQDIISNAKQAEGPDTPDVLEVLNKIDDREYDSPAGIMHEIENI